MSIGEGLKLACELIPRYVVSVAHSLVVPGWAPVFGVAAIGSAAASAALARTHRAVTLLWGLLPILGSFAIVFFGGLYESQRMEMDDPNWYFLGFELALIASLFWLLRPHWGMLAAWSVFCLTVFLIAIGMANAALEYDMA